MRTKDAIVENWLPRYTDTPLAEFGEYILLTNFDNYVEKFARRFDVPVRGLDRPMQTATHNRTQHHQLRYRFGQRRDRDGSTPGDQAKRRALSGQVRRCEALD